MPQDISHPAGAAGTLQVGEFRLDRTTGDLAGPDGTTRLEPKLAELLVQLATCAGQVLSRERLTAALWPDVVVGDDSLARAVSRLRIALGDDAKAPRYIETLPKRGYRLIAEAAPAGASTRAVPGPAPTVVAPARRVRVPTGWAAACVAVVLAAVVWLVLRPGGLEPGGPQPVEAGPAAPASGALLMRADHAYFQFSRRDNEAAIELYQRVLGLNPDDPVALAGLANALVQRSIRWPQLPGEPQVAFTRLRDALAHGHLERDPVRRQLQRARLLADRAVAVAPQSAAAHKAVGFVASAEGRFDDALDSHRRAVVLDDDYWQAMINIADVLEIDGRPSEALPWYARAYDAMSRVYESQGVEVRQWQPELGTLLGERHEARGSRSEAEGWYRRVLVQAPLHPGATSGLARVLREGGDQAEAERLCAQLRQRTGTPCRGAAGDARAGGQAGGE